ncbi:MAG: hypothetical protein ACTSVV_10780 [Promethearchaeota archaeon]
MKSLLKLNIIKSLKYIQESNTRIPSHLIEIKNNVDIDSLGPLTKYLTTDAFQPFTLFYRDSNNEIKSIQEKFFGIYALKTIIKNTLISIPFLKGALEPVWMPLLPGILLHYTASFHLVIAFLALHGRVLIDEVFGPPLVQNKGMSYKKLPNAPDKIMAILTKSNKWIFEPRPRSHKKVWRELKPIFIEQQKIPPEFREIFEYLTSYGPFTISDDEELIQYGIDRIVEVRHEACYTGFGFDDFAFDSIINRDFPGVEVGLDAKLKVYSKFSLNLLERITTNLIDILDSVNFLQKEYKRRVVTIILNPPFDYLSYPQWKNSENIRKKIDKIHKWLIESIYDPYWYEK